MHRGDGGRDGSGNREPGARGGAKRIRALHASQAITAETFWLTKLEIETVAHRRLVRKAPPQTCTLLRLESGSISGRTAAADDITIDVAEANVMLLPLLRGQDAPRRDDLAQWTRGLVSDCHE